MGPQPEARRWLLRGHLPGLQDELEQENDAADDETGEDRTPERPSAQAGIPGRQSGPETERKGLQPDDDADGVGERDAREMENEQDSQRWDGEQENRNSKRAVTSHSVDVGRLPSSTSWTRLPEKTCVVQIATTGPTMTTTTSNGFNAAQPS